VIDHTGECNGQPCTCGAKDAKPAMHFCPCDQKDPHPMHSWFQDGNGNVWVGNADTLGWFTCDGRGPL
jgi:hypothetical protein